MLLVSVEKLAGCQWLEADIHTRKMTVSSEHNG